MPNETSAPLKDGMTESIEIKYFEAGIRKCTCFRLNVMNRAKTTILNYI